MESVSTRLNDETARLIRETAEERGVSVAEVLRERIEQGMDYDDVKRENERLRAEKRTLISQREEHTELVEYVTEERTMQQREQERRDAPLWTRVRWLVLGRDRG